MKFFKKLIVLLLVFSFVFLGLVYFVNSVESKTVEEIQQEIDRYQKETDRLSAQSKTLSNQIAQFDAQIKLTSLKISQIEEKISLLTGRIDLLEGSLGKLTEAFSSRTVETYKMVRLGDPMIFLLSAPDLSEAALRFNFLQKIQEADRDLLMRLQKAQTSYKAEKETQEELQAQLEKQKANLDIQKKAKANLLAVTKNDEKRYQSLLAGARAELAISLGQGKETFLRNVSEGEKIGTLISGSSGCSSGTHLHFEVHQGTSIEDPNNYLKSISFSYSPGYDTSYYGSVNPRGSWNWPLSEPIQINQGYGSHPFAKAFYPGGVHNGIDIDSNDNSVKAVKSGKLYGGSYQCGGTYAGALLYAKVDHGDGTTTWYLHITPQ